MRDSFERKIQKALGEWGWKRNTEEGMIMLLELMVKTQRGCYNSHTETGFLNSMKVMTKSGFPNKLGREFMMYMLYESSNQRPPAFKMMQNYRL
ncbi:hypothetical protein vBVhaSMAG7_062 [Vibrio phage vB_VhaS_MAG7]|nr:hypothetical protein vBVhaSMAG7_062 [Vibrio phage vB_VhaS_MAG7]